MIANEAFWDEISEQIRDDEQRAIGPFDMDYTDLKYWLIGLISFKAH